jgi:transposase InsO family protein
MNDSQVNSIDEISSILKSNTNIAFKAKDQNEAYRWIQGTLIKFNYHNCYKRDKRIIRDYVGKVTGYSEPQITRLIRKQKKTGYISVNKGCRNKFEKKYEYADIRLLAGTDELHDYPNGAALKKILARMWEVYKNKAYKNIAQISVAYIYIVRRSLTYRRITKHYQKTKPNVVNIGVREKPKPNGKPGIIRVDTVHQGDRNGEKGVYHINTIDEITQFEIIGAAEKISEAYLLPLLAKLIEAYPFKIVQFHADNGSEFINHQVANLLNKLLIKLTKSRARRPNDNALVETKNGSIIRKWMGYTFIAQKHADRINKFYFGYFNEYINYHRPCGYATNKKNHKGKIKKVYKPEDYKTPYEKFKNLPNAKAYLKKGTTFKKLDKIALSKTDNEMAELVQKERSKLFDEII